MNYILQKTFSSLAMLYLLSGIAFAQISPGDLSSAHAELEGISNCKKCHELGKKVSSAKCLECHTEIKELIDNDRGYHVSSEVKGKECFHCHNEHHGKDFEISRFDKDNFDHELSKYSLLGRHNKIECTECHKSSNIPIKKSKKSGLTYLGLQTSCTSCHLDYHQQTLSSDCATCHSFDSFKPTRDFNHQKTKFPLLGKHNSVDCIKCHAREEKNGKLYQKFVGLAYSNCTICRWFQVFA